MEFTTKVCAGYIEAVVKGEFDLLDGKACTDAAFQLCEQHKIWKVLIHALAMSENVSVGSRFSIGEYMATQANFPLRAAILVSTRLVQESKALQNTANNRGASVLTTDSLAQAALFLGVDISDAKV
ncbi:MAG: hypothetical protein ABI905_10740 [Betaproteobacteria bacterium]